jgi:predicted small secreted protein
MRPCSWKVIFALVLICLAVPALSACNTLNGMGQDMEGAGRSMQDTF